MGHAIRASKVIGTAGVKDSLCMQDAGAEVISDFFYLGFQSTCPLAENGVLSIFENLDAKYANNPRTFRVVELADGVLRGGA